MRSFVLATCVLIAAAGVASAQSVDDEIARAVLAAPQLMADDAMVVRLAEDGSHEVLREGSNGLVCYDRSREPGRSFAVQCTSVENLARVGQTYRLRVAAGNADDARKSIAAAEASGSREAPKFGSVWYSLTGESESAVTPHQSHITVAVPFATSDALSLPSEGGYSRAGAWIMEAGTSAAHIMIPGR